jgi:hypothetical protein
MAYMNQEKKKQIKAELDKVLPKGWKVSLVVDNYTALRASIMSAPVDLMLGQPGGHRTINHYHLDSSGYTGETLETIKKICKALNCINYDKSDAMVDHFDVGYYLSVQVGKWDKPFTCTQN